MRDLPLHEDIRAYYRCALRALVAVELRAPQQQRIGPAADSRWLDVAGDLTIAHRIDLVLRDADRAWRGAFGARRVFDLTGIHEDESFPPGWPGWPATEKEPAKHIWDTLTASSPNRELPPLLAELVAYWHRTATPHACPTPTPTSRWWVQGLSALVAAISAFAPHDNLNWPAQVCVTAAHPSERQLALLAVPLLGRQAPLELVDACPDGYEPVTSDDALPRPPPPEKRA